VAKPAGLDDLERAMAEACGVVARA
jgi:hypothetical protein